MQVISPGYHILCRGNHFSSTGNLDRIIKIGNMTASALVDHNLTHRKNSHTLPDHPFVFVSLFIPLTLWVTSGINCGPDLRNLYILLLYQNSVGGCFCTVGSHLCNNKQAIWENAPACIHLWIRKYSDSWVQMLSCI